MNQPKLLLVEDDENIRVLLGDCFTGEPYTLLEAADGQAALEAVDRDQVDLILLDVMMPGMSGLEVLNRLQAQDRTRHIPVIMVTALGGDSQITLCLDAGAVDHIVKPFSAQVVRARVRAALRNRQAVDAERQPRRGKVIGFVGAKGGVGNSTAAVNVALALASGRSVVIAELRSCLGTVAHQFGIKSGRNLQPLLDQNAEDISSDSLAKCLTPQSSQLQLLLAPPSVEELREITPQHAEAILKALAATADYVIVDLPCLPSRATRTALQCCDFVILTVALEPICVAAAQVMLSGLATWGLGGNSLGAVLIMHQGAEDSPAAVSQARAQLACRIVSVIPPFGDVCLRDLSTAQPLLLANPDSLDARAFVALAARLTADQVPELVN